MTMEQSFADQEAELGRAAASETALPDPGKAKGFSALLRLWRRKLLQTLVARSQLERELGSALHAVDSTR